MTTMNQSEEKSAEILLTRKSISLHLSQRTNSHRDLAGNVDGDDDDDADSDDLDHSDRRGDAVIELDDMVGDVGNDIGDDGASMDSEDARKATASAYDRNLAKREMERIRMFRVMVGGMLLMTAAVTITAYILLGQEETKNFEEAYGQFARSLADAAIDQQQSLRDSLNSLGNEITGYAQQQQEQQTNNNDAPQWPFVVLPLFESYAEGYFDHSAGEFVGVNNLVYHDDREAYTNWTNANFEDWILEGHMLQYGHDDFLDKNMSLYQPYISKKTADGYPPDDVRDYYSPRTSQSPPMRSYGPVMNLNIASIGSNGDVVDGVLLLGNETLVTALKPFNALPAEEHQNFHTDSEEYDHPHSFMYHPVYQRVKDPSSGVVATVTSSVAWDASMRNLLPKTVKGIRCVIKNNCDQSFTYEVVGPEANYKGEGDLHDTQYDYLEATVDLALHTHPDFARTPGHCQYTMSIYPTDAFKADYTTSLPLYFAVIVASTFGLAALVFFVYDFTAQKRNQELAATAAKSNQLVSSLFPGAIKDRLLDQQDISHVSRLSGNKPTRFKKKAKEDTRPLAMVYENTTVMFADLSGFTQWSSTRTPVEVFELLETLYSTFDSLARKRMVFKVETIGDCYVAATGLPEPQADHAIRMCRFVSDCMANMDTVVVSLSESLGEDTTTLKLRAGMHSGSVTGGVLRGDKSRFQLFGDTMNTASRMESNGIPGRIQVSKSTADELIKARKDSWLTARPDKVMAKGKGEMDTFFVIVPVDSDKSGKSANTNTDASSNVPDQNEGAIE